MLTSNYTEALNARSNMNSPEIDGCAECKERLVDVKEEIGKQKNSFTEVVTNFQEKSKKCAKELDEFKQKSKDTAECELKLEIQEEVVRDQKAEIDRLNLIIEDLKSKNPDSENSKGGTGGKTDKDTGDNTSVICAEEITWDHTRQANCGYQAKLYGGELGKKGYNTSDIIRAFHPEMYNNPEIMKNIGTGANHKYFPLNYTFTFSSNINDNAYNNNATLSSQSNMRCDKCKDKPSLFCKDQSSDVKTFCYPGPNIWEVGDSIRLLTKGCPNLISKSSSEDVIKAKQHAPLILVNRAEHMIDKDGNSTEVRYAYLKPYLKVDGTMKDCSSGDTKCKQFEALFNITITNKYKWT